MKLNRNHLLSLLTISFFILIAVASVPSKKGMTVENGQIPPGFEGYKGTLLIVKQSRDWSKYAEKYFSNNYNGKFLLIGEKDLKTGYADTKEYRFILGRDLNYTREMGTLNDHVSSENLCIMDRQSGKSYCTGSSAFYGKLLKAYSVALDKEREK